MSGLYRAFSGVAWAMMLLMVVATISIWFTEGFAAAADPSRRMTSYWVQAIAFQLYAEHLQARVAPTERAEP